MDNRLVGLFPKERSLAQIVGVKLAEPQNGNGKHGKKALVFHDERLFWNSSLNAYSDTPGLSREIRGLQAYKLSALAYACMSYRATKFIEPPIWIKEEVDGEEQWLDGDHPLARLLEEPNPDMDMPELLEIMSLYLDGTGRVLLVKTRDRGGRVAALYPFSGDEFTVEQADGLAYGKFKVNTSKGQQTYGPDDVIFWKETDPRNMMDGLAPLEVALSSINVDEEMKLAVRALLRNKMRPGAVMVFPQGIPGDDETAKRVAEQIKANYSAAQNTGKLMIVEGTDKAPEPWDSSLKDLALGPINENAEAAICSAFKVHPAIVHALIGIKNSSGFADTIKPATDLFYDVVVIPRWTRFEAKLTTKLLREADDNPLRFIRFDTSKIPAMQEDLGARIKEASEAAGIWMLDERRQHTGKPALPDGDERGDRIGAVAVAVPQSPEPTKSAKSLPAPPVTKTIESKRDARLRLWRKFDVKATREESRYEKEALAQFEHEKSEVVKLFEGSTDTHLRAALEKLKAAYTRKDGEYHLQWIKRYTKLVTETFDVAGSDLAAEIGFAFSLENPKVQFAIRNRVNKLSGNVTDATYQKIQDVVSTGRSEGVGTSEIANRIREDVFGGEITKTRATTIARTETVAALNEGEQIAAVESGVIQSKEWLSQGDAKVRDGHDIDGETVPLDSQFSNGLEYPGDQRGSADNVINCRCTLLYSDEAA